MRSRWVAVVALAAMVQMLPGAARAGGTEEEEDKTETWADDGDDEDEDDDEDEEESGPRVILRIDRPTARLQQRTMLGWRNICIPPCGAVVDPRGTYRIAGGGAVASPPFLLPRESGDVFVEGRVGSKAKRIAGLCFLIGGAAAIGYTGFLWATTPPASDEARDRGLYLLAIESLVAGLGAALLTGGRTSLRVR